jgi:ribosome-associated toxin RatA of RatAB toxin-antitoxin module
VLTDYEHLAEFIPGITRSVVKERRDNRLIVEQAGEARFLLFTFPVEVTYEVIESPQGSISSRAVAGNLKRMSGRYGIETEGAGSRLRYEGFVDPDFNVPDFLEAAALRAMVDEQFAAMAAEIERRAAKEAAK